MHSPLSPSVLAVAALIALPLVPAQAEVVFYGGDGTGSYPYLASDFSVYNFGSGPTVMSDSMTYDDFTLTSLTTLNAAWGNFRLSWDTNPTEAAWQVRSGVSTGNGGTLVAAGTNATTILPTGRGEYQVRVPLSLMLEPGTYWIGIAPRVTSFTTNAYVSATDGGDLGPGGDPNPVPTGSPIANGNSFFNSPLSGHNFVSVDAGIPRVIAPGTWDFSYGVEGTVIPEPGTGFVLLLAPCAARRRRR
jgi:hypothetical protein